MVKSFTTAYIIVHVMSSYYLWSFHCWNFGGLDDDTKLPDEMKRKNEIFD